MFEFPFRAAIFDLDGTLIDSMSYWRSIGAEFLENFGITPDQEALALMEKMTLQEAAYFMKNRYLLDETVKELWKGLTKTAQAIYTEKAALKAGVVDTLRLLKVQRIPMGIATVADKKDAKRALSRLGIKKYFSCLMTDADVGKGKNEPDLYLAVAKKLKTAPADCAVFEDSFSFGKVAKDAGFRLYAVKDRENLDIFDRFLQISDGEAPWNDEN